MNNFQKPKPVTIRGVSYPSMCKAAKALGVSQQAISVAIERGTLDQVGKGKSRPVKIKINGITYQSISKAAQELNIGYYKLLYKIYGRVVKKEISNHSFILIRDKLYSSAKSAAFMQGVTEQTIQEAIENGRLQYVGNGRNKARKIVIDGKEYPSIKDANRETGIDYYKLRRTYGDKR